MSELQDPRVLFSGERTLLAWNRTSLSLIAFGFLVERTGVYTNKDIFSTQTLLMFWIGFAFILLGALALIYSTKQYSRVLRTLTPEEFPHAYAPRWGMLINLLVAALSVLLIFVLAISHWQ